MTRETVSVLSAKMEMFEKALDEVKNDVKWLHDKLDRNFDSFANLMKEQQKENEQKYASKNIEKWFYSLVGMILSFVLLALLWTVIS